MPIPSTARSLHAPVEKPPVLVNDFAAPAREIPGSLLRSATIFSIIALFAIAIRLAPQLRQNLAFAIPDFLELSETDRAIINASPWQNAQVHRDSFEYLQLADGLKGGCGFARKISGSCRSPEIVRTPGYPLFLSFFSSLRTVLIAQALLSGLLCLLVAFCVASRWGISSALAAEFLVALDLPSLTLANQIMSDTLFAVALAVALICPLLSIRRADRSIILAIISGLASALAILVRPIGLILLILAPIPFLIMHKTAPRLRLALVAIAFAVPFASLGGWTARNYMVAGYRGLSTIGSINLYFYRAAGVVARQRHESLLEVRTDFEERLGVRFDAVYQSQSAQMAQRLDQLAIPILFEHPLETGAMTVQSAAYLALSPIRAQLANVIGLPSGPAGLGLNAAPSSSHLWSVFRQVAGSPMLAEAVLLQAAVILVLWAGVARTILRWPTASREFRVWSFHLVGFALLLLLLASGAEADARFRIPVVAPLAVVAGIGFFGEREEIQDRGGVS